jgi:thiol:disulfide interchange protein
MIMKLKNLITVLFSVFIILIASNPIFAQFDEPVKWRSELELVDDENAYVVIYADIDDDWDLYAQDIEGVGPMPLFFEFEESENYELIGVVKEVFKASEKYDEVFNINVKYFKKHAEFRQEIKIISSEGFDIKGLIDGQACFVDGACVPIYGDFSVQVNGGGISVDGEKKTSSNETPVFVTDNQFEDDEEEGGMFSFFIIAFLFGILAILTPCVFPMIPMTIAFFMQKSASKFKSILKALIFGSSVVVLYSLVGVIVSLTSAGANFTTVLSTNWIPNLIFFILFVVFAASLFGLFEFVLPSSLVNKADSKVDKGGMIAAFFLALTVVIVSFSCTGPIIGALLVQATTGSILQPSIGMFGFGLGFALPFTILAISPKWLKNLPKSGGWLNSVKVVMGFLILAFSLKFLSNIDQNYHLGLMSRDVYIAIWIVLFVLMGMYLLGKIKFSHDSELKHLGFFRLMLAIATFTFAIYLLPGMFGANLSSISGLIPPKTDQQFDLTAVYDADVDSDLCEKPKYADRLFLPYNIQAYFDYKQGLDCAKSQEKPVLLYFTGHSCSNCKKMQGEIWTDKRVQTMFNTDFVVTALYVDDRVIELDEKDQFVSSNDGKLKKRLGEANADIQIVNFAKNSQPYYVTMTPDGRVLAPPMTYNNNVEEFVEFLEKSIEAYNNPAE